MADGRPRLRRACRIRVTQRDWRRARCRHRSRSAPVQGPRRKPKARADERRTESTSEPSVLRRVRVGPDVLALSSVHHHGHSIDSSTHKTHAAEVLLEYNPARSDRPIRDRLCYIYEAIGKQVARKNRTNARENVVYVHKCTWFGLIVYRFAYVASTLLVLRCPNPTGSSRVRVERRILT